MIRITAVIAAALSLSACAQGPTMSELPQPEVPDNMSRIVVYRSSIMGTAVQPMVYVDGQATKKCQPRGAFDVVLPKGVHRISASTEAERFVTIDTTDDDVAYIKCGIGLGVMVGQPTFTPVSDEVGSAESAGLSRIQ